MERVGRVVALGVCAVGEAAGGFSERKMAMDFYGMRVGDAQEGGELCAFGGILGAEVGFEEDAGAMRREREEEIGGSGAEATGEFAGGVLVDGMLVERGVEGLFDVVLGEESEAESGGERARESGFAGGRRAGDEDEAAGLESGHDSI